VIGNNRRRQALVSDHAVLDCVANVDECLGHSMRNMAITVGAALRGHPSLQATFVGCVLF
jgi:hypothetical protein